MKKCIRYLVGFSYFEVMVALLIFSTVSVSVMRSCIQSTQLASDSRNKLIAMQLLANYNAWKAFSGDSMPSLAWQKDLVLLPTASYHLTPTDNLLDSRLQLCWQSHEKQCLTVPQD